MADAPTSRDLFLAILAMDSYNRGYDRGIDKNGTKLVEGGALGNATFLSDANDSNGIAKAAGFYAIAYNWNGEKIVAYRGTDKLSPSFFGLNGSGSDFEAYGIGIGQPFSLTGGLTAQARLTIEFYRKVAGEGSDPFAANITTTGHSLGGGLAGYAAMLYGKESAVFANMAFENSAAATRGAALVGSMFGVDQTLVYGNGPIYALDRSNIHALAVNGELLGYTLHNRIAQQTPEYVLESFDTDTIGSGDLHSMALHTALIWAEVNRK